MSRYLRYLLIWLSCTAVSVTAVLLTVHFVVGSTRPTPPVARSAPTVFGSHTARHPADPARKSRTPAHSPSATSRAPAARPTPAPPATGSARPTPRDTSSKTAIPSARAGECTGGSGVHTIESAGGQASVDFGDSGVCLVSAVPTQGFTVRTAQREPAALSVTFSGDGQESVITATTGPQDKATVREASW
ncbi:hypothetical protein ACH429_04180 [Streptomyces pathocidini]|uniref:Uncharacterized protein n=1 Tax=Streptomyces pathocidini TaxID=1650571 RepID=A0ABW7UPR4_9ACTN